jgi:hemoglobin
MQDIAHIIGLEKVREIVSIFYDRVQQHPTLAEPFGIVHDWVEHKEHLSHFWWGTLGGPLYRDKPYRVAQKHEEAGFTPALLHDWLALFHQTLHENLPDDQADAWFGRAMRIGQSLKMMYDFRQSVSPDQTIINSD